MTKDEFKLWLADFAAAFPWVPEFLTKSGDNVATAMHWATVLEDASLDDALLVTKRMLSGKDPEVESTNRASTPRHVAQLARALVARRSGDSGFVPEFVVATQPKTAWQASDVIGRLLSCAANGGDVAALADKLMPLDPEESPRYRCLLCKDRGRVTCWHPESMELARLGKFDGTHGWYQCAVVCSCPEGDRLDKDNALVRFDAGRWIRVDDCPSAKALTERMQTWEPVTVKEWVY